MRVTKQNEHKRITPPLNGIFFFMFLTCIQTPPSAQIKKLRRDTSVDRPR